MNTVLITGGAGFLGSHLVRGLLKKYSDIEVRALSRHENDMAEMIVSCHSDRLKPIIGDIREVDTVIHLAAMKHIGFCESHPFEAVTINTGVPQF